MKVCLLPQVSKLSGSIFSSIGGVNRVIYDMAKYLALAGVEIVEDPDVADVIHCHAVETHPGVSVYTNHGFWEEPVTPWEILANQRMTEMIMTARIVTSPSEWSMEVYRDKLDVRPRLVRNGIDIPALLRVPEGNAFKWLGINKNKPYLLYGKNKIQGPPQGEAIRTLAEKLPHMYVVATVFPEGDIPENVIVTGLLPYDKMMEAIRDSLALISITKECFSIQVIEALAMGKPVLGWQYGGTAEVIQNGVNGHLEAPGASLQQSVLYLLNNYSTLSQGASLSALEFDLRTKIIPQFIQIYEECM